MAAKRGSGEGERRLVGMRVDFLRGDAETVTISFDTQSLESLLCGGEPRTSAMGVFGQF